MQKSTMSPQQLANRAQVFDVLAEDGWALRNVEAFDADLFLDAEVCARRRNAHCIMEIKTSYQKAYVSIAAANFEAGRVEYLIYFDALDDVFQIVRCIIADAAAMTVAHCSALAIRLCETFGDVYAFDGETSVPICVKQARRGAP